MALSCSMRMLTTDSTGTGRRNTHSTFVSIVDTTIDSIFTALDLGKEIRFMGGKIGSGGRGNVLYGHPSTQSGRI